MTWSYQAFTSGQADGDLWNQVINSLNKLNSSQALTVKISSSDQKGGDSRAVYFYLVDPDQIPDPATLGTTWTFKEFSTNTNYNAMYQELADFLNNDTSLTNIQKFYSLTSMTNAQGHDSKLILWYRNQT